MILCAMKPSISKKNSWINLSDINVFQQQYRQNCCQLKYFGMQYLSDEEVISDLIQDIWLRIWEKRSAHHINEQAFKLYLFRSLYRAILNYIKHKNVIKEYEEDVLNYEEDLEQEITYKIIESEIYQTVNHVFDELSLSCKRVYAASLSGKSQKEIAEELSISINTVKKHINNANHYMKKRLKDILALILIFR